MVISEFVPGECMVCERTRQSAPFRCFAGASALCLLLTPIYVTALLFLILNWNVPVWAQWSACAYCLLIVWIAFRVTEPRKLVFRALDGCRFSVDVENQPGLFGWTSRPYTRAGNVIFLQGKTSSTAVMGLSRWSIDVHVTQTRGEDVKGKVPVYVAQLFQVHCREDFVHFADCLATCLGNPSVRISDGTSGTTSAEFSWEHGEDCRETEKVTAPRFPRSGQELSPQLTQKYADFSPERASSVVQVLNWHGGQLLRFACRERRDAAPILLLIVGGCAAHELWLDLMVKSVQTGSQDEMLRLGVVCFVQTMLMVASLGWLLLVLFPSYVAIGPAVGGRASYALGFRETPYPQTDASFVYVEKEMSEEKRLRWIIVGRSSFDVFRTPIGRDWSSQADATIPLAIEISRLLNVPLIIDRKLQEELLRL